jgi:TolB-like protein/class 3 adenylate cyclase
MSERGVQRRLAAILAADVVGYSLLMGEDEAGTLVRLKALRDELIAPKIAQHKGRIVKTTGDGMLVEFSSIVEAVACAAAWQAAIDGDIRWRIGINVGDVIIDGEDIYGDGVNIAARLEALAEPGGICVSARVQEDATGRLDLEFEDIGEQSLKNITRPVRVYRVASPHPNPVSKAGEVARATFDAPALPDKPSIAVLPFQNMSGDPEQEYFADGMVEEITTAIARFPWLFVIARNSSFTYKGKAVDVRQVARELGVRYVLEGSVRKGGNRVRITGQLIDTSTGVHIWADRFDGSLDDIFELQDEVASRVVGVIEPRLRLTETDRASRKPTENLDAYDHYLRSLAQSYKRTQESVAEAIRLACLALQLEPAFAPAMARIAASRQFQRLQRWIPASGAEVEEGIHMARQVLAVGSDNPEVLRAAGVALAALAGENETALTALDRAIELNRNYAAAHAQRGLILTWLNRPDEAIVAAERAIRLSPNDPFVFEAYIPLYLAHLAAGRYEEALSWADRALGNNSGLPALRVKLSLCGYLCRREAASECLKRLRDTYPEPTVAAVMSDMAKGMSPELVAK